MLPNKVTVSEIIKTINQKLLGEVGFLNGCGDLGAMKLQVSKYYGPRIIEMVPLIAVKLTSTVAHLTSYRGFFVHNFHC